MGILGVLAVLACNSVEHARGRSFHSYVTSVPSLDCVLPGVGYILCLSRIPSGSRLVVQHRGGLTTCALTVGVAEARAPCLNAANG